MLDRTDKELLVALQENAQLTAQELGERLNLSSSQAGRRKLRLESLGYIKGYSAKLDPEKLGLNVEAFVQIITATHEPSTAADFMRHLNNIPEVTNAWTLTGEADYLLRIYCADLRALNAIVHQQLLTHRAVSRVHSQIVMDKIKADAPLPVAPA